MENIVHQFIFIMEEYPCKTTDMLNMEMFYMTNTEYTKHGEFQCLPYSVFGMWNIYQYMASIYAVVWHGISVHGLYVFCCC